MISLEHVSKSYAAGIPALNDVSIIIEDVLFELDNKGVMSWVQRKYWYETG